MTIIVILAFSWLSFMSSRILSIWGHTNNLSWGCWCVVDLWHFWCLKEWIFVSIKVLLFGYDILMGYLQVKKMRRRKVHIFYIEGIRRPIPPSWDLTTVILRYWGLNHRIDSSMSYRWKLPMILYWFYNCTTWSWKKGPETSATGTKCEVIRWEGSMVIERCHDHINTSYKRNLDLKCAGVKSQEDQARGKHGHTKNISAHIDDHLSHDLMNEKFKSNQ